MQYIFINHIETKFISYLHNGTALWSLPPSYLTAVEFVKLTLIFANSTSQVFAQYLSCIHVCLGNDELHQSALLDIKALVEMVQSYIHC